MASDLSALIARVEAATGADRELDAEISVAVGRHETHIERRSDGTAKLLPWRGDGTGSGIVECRRYTASLDAAVSLVPSGWDWSVNASCFGYVRGLPQAGQDMDPEGWCRNAATPALALCAAALRARQAQEGSGHG
jgi:hypothetical protein